MLLVLGAECKSVCRFSKNTPDRNCILKFITVLTAFSQENFKIFFGEKEGVEGFYQSVP